MKKILFSLASLLAFGQSVQAAPVTFFGHWTFSNDLYLGGPDYGHVYAGDNDFTVADWKTIAFLACAREQYPEAPVFLFGTGAVVTKAYVCKGDVNLGSCAAPVTVCNGTATGTPTDAALSAWASPAIACAIQRGFATRDQKLSVMAYDPTTLKVFLDGVAGTGTLAWFKVVDDGLYFQDIASGTLTPCAN